MEQLRCRVMTERGHADEACHLTQQPFQVVSDRGRVAQEPGLRLEFGPKPSPDPNHIVQKVWRVEHGRAPTRTQTYP